MKKKSIKNLTIFLFKNNVTNIIDCVEHPELCKNIILKDVLPTDGIIIIGQPSMNEPHWKKFLEEGAKESLPTLKNSSNKAVLLLKVNSRFFALTFGYGRYLLKDENIERNFGLKTVVNAVSADMLRSLDISNLEELTVHKKIQTSISSKREAFRLDVATDLLKAVTGKPREAEYAQIISGREALIISSRIDFNEIMDKLAKSYNYYISDAYKDNFEWIDNLKEVKEESILSIIRASLISDIKNKKLDKMHLAPPEVLNWETIEGFSYRKRRIVSLENDIDIEKYSMSIDLACLTWKQLKKNKIFVHFSDSGTIIPKWSVLDCINYETDIGGEKYILTYNRVYNVKKSFADEIYESIKSIPNYHISLLDCPAGKNDEGKYNDTLSKSNSNFVLIDKTKLRYNEIRSPIEACDIYVKQKHFIHVKYKYSSSTLSHLFAQGKISGEAFKREKKVREQFNKIIKKLKPLDADFLINENSYNAEEYTIVFAIIDKSSKPLEDSLPFFSLLNFMQTAKDLRMLGYNVVKSKIKKN